MVTRAPKRAALSRLLRARRRGEDEWQKHIIVLDSGSAVSLIHVNNPLVDCNKLCPTDITISGAFKGDVAILGTTTLEVELGQTTFQIEFIVVNNAIFSLLIGWPDLKKAKLTLNGELITCRGKPVGIKPNHDNFVKDADGAFYLEYKEPENGRREEQSDEEDT